MSDQASAAGVRLLALFAHPDDEQLIGAAFTKAVQAGARAFTVIATRGDAGQILVPDLATPETLGAVRTGEMERAAAVLGWEPPILLDYPDGGMHEIDRQLVTDDFVRVIREIKPDVVVTFDKTGGYGHLDHITVHYAATEAFDLAADPDYRPELGEPHAARKRYEAVVPRSIVRMLFAQDDTADVGGDRRTIERDEIGALDETITTTIVAPDLIPLLRESVLSHRTQWSEEWIERWQVEPYTIWFSHNSLIRVHPAPEPGVALPDEDSLLAGLGSSY